MFSKARFKEVVSQPFFDYFQSLFPVNDDTKAVEVEAWYREYQYVVKVDTSNKIIYGMTQLKAYADGDEKIGYFAYAPEVNIVYWHK